MAYILSTMTNPVSYCFYQETSDLPIVRKQITIQGGAHIASTSKAFGEVTKNAEGQPMWTPSGNITPVKDCDLPELMNHPVFKMHLDQGFLKIIKSDLSNNYGAVAKEVRTMQAKDSFAPLTNETWKGKAKLSQPGSNSNLL